MTAICDDSGVALTVTHSSRHRCAYPCRLLLPHMVAACARSAPCGIYPGRRISHNLSIRPPARRPVQRCVNSRSSERGHLADLNQAPYVPCRSRIDTASRRPDACRHVAGHASARSDCRFHLSASLSVMPSAWVMRSAGEMSRRCASILMSTYCAHGMHGRP